MVLVVVVFVKNNLIWDGSVRGWSRWDLDRPTGNRSKDRGQCCWHIEERSIEVGLGSAEE